MIKVRTCSPVFKGESNSSSWMFQSGIIKKKKCCRENPVCPASAVSVYLRGKTRSSRESEGERSSLPSLSVKEDALDNERG